ncbi:MAG: DUF1501 domain-containing protein [Verrucomicrobiota bacterium]|jgi:hypothetical protein|nr:MAG: DUF1501 domain-containing protein [Verrucomicrobiota bacterium]
MKPLFCDGVNFDMSRRDFFGKFAMGIGGFALMNLLQKNAQGSSIVAPPIGSPFRGVLQKPHFAPKAKRIIYLFMAGGPSQHDLFDYKPLLNKMQGQDLPESVRAGQRLTGMSQHQAHYPLAGSMFKFSQYGQSRAWVSDLMPNTAKMADELCFIRSMHTEHINHDPAITFFNTGHQLPGRPSMGSWLSYGLGSLNQNLPGFVVLISKDRIDQPLYSRLWGNGFLPSIHQGVQFRGGSDPVLFLKNPDGISQQGRRNYLDRLAELNTHQSQKVGDPEIESRIAQYEMAYRMQTSVPEVMDLSGETEETYALYGSDVKKPGTFAANCLLARRLAEQDVRFIQLYHPGWDQHGALPKQIRKQCADVDQGCYALITDLKRRGLLDDTLVVWGGEFGRTNYSQGKLTIDDYGRDHHPRCFTVWMAGAGIKPGYVYGSTDELGYNIQENPVSVHDLQATILHQMGINHEALTFKHQGRYYRLTDVEGQVINAVMT